MSHFFAPKPSSVNISPQQHKRLERLPSESTSPLGPAASPLIEDTVDIPLDEPSSLSSPTSAFHEFYQQSYRRPDRHHDHYSITSSYQHRDRPSAQQHQPLTESNRRLSSELLAHKDKRNRQTASLGSPDSLTLGPHSPTFVPLQHQQAAVSPVFQALSSTLTAALSTLTHGPRPPTTTTTAAAAGQDDASTNLYSPSVLPQAAGIGAHNNGKYSVGASSTEKIIRANQPAATVRWTAWARRPSREHVQFTGDNALPCFIIGYDSGALQVYEVRAANSDEDDGEQFAKFQEVAFLQGLTMSVSNDHASRPSHEAPHADHRQGVGDPPRAEVVHGALFISAKQLVVLAEVTETTLSRPADGERVREGKRALQLIMVNLPESTASASTPDMGKASATYRIRELNASEGVVSAELRASGTTLLVVAVSVCDLTDAFATVTSELHPLRLRNQSVAEAKRHSTFSPACAPLVDLPSGMLPTFDICGRTLAYAATCPTISTRDRAAGGNFVAADGAFGSHGVAAGERGSGFLDGESGDTRSGGHGLSAMGSAGGGAAAAAMMVNLGQRAAAAGLSSVSALTAAATARFSPSSIGSGTGPASPTTTLEGQQNGHGPATAISIGAGAGVDIAKRVGGGMMQGVRGLSGYFGSPNGGFTLSRRGSPQYPYTSSSVSPPFVSSPLSRSAPSGQPGLSGRTVAGLTSTTSVDRASLPQGTSPSHPRRYSQNSAVQSPLPRGMHGTGSTSGSPVRGAGVTGVDSALQSSSDSPLLQPSSHEEISPTPWMISDPSRGTALSNGQLSTTSTSAKSKRSSVQSPHGPNIGAEQQPSYLSHHQPHHGPAAITAAQTRITQNAGPVWVRVVDLGPAIASSRPRTLALFRPPNSTLGLLGQVGLGWSSGNSTGPAHIASPAQSFTQPRSPPATTSGTSASPHKYGPLAAVSSHTVSSGAVTAAISPSALLANPVTLLSLSPDGSSLLTADVWGQVFHVWEIMPHPAPAELPNRLSSTGFDGKARLKRDAVHRFGGTGAGDEENLPPSVWHRYKLLRGHTSARAVSAVWSSDGRFVFVQSQRGTVHGYPVNAHGGISDVEKHVFGTVSAKPSHSTSVGLGKLSIEVKALARLRAVELPVVHGLSSLHEDRTLSDKGALLHRQGATLGSATASVCLLEACPYPQPPQQTQPGTPTRDMQLLVYLPAQDAVVLHSFACQAAPAADQKATNHNSVDRAGSSFMSVLPRSVSAPVTAVATGAATAASSGLSRIISRPGVANDASSASGTGTSTSRLSRIFVGGNDNVASTHGLVGDSVATGAWCGLSRAHVPHQAAYPQARRTSNTHDQQSGRIDVEETQNDPSADGSEALEPSDARRLLPDRHLRHGSSPLSRPLIDELALDASSASGSDGETGTKAKTTDSAATNSIRAGNASRRRGPDASQTPYASSVDMPSSASSGVGESRKTTATSSPGSAGKKKHKQHISSAADSAIPKLELPPSKTAVAAQSPDGEALRSTQIPSPGAPQRSLPPFSSPRWVTQIEVETYSRAPRVLPSSIWLSHQFDFREPKDGQRGGPIAVHNLFRQKTSKVAVRDEVEVEAPTSADRVDFHEGLSVAIGAQSYGSGTAGAMGSDVPGRFGSYRVPMFPQGLPARHQAWHERVIAAGGVPIRHVAGGLGHGLGRAGRELGRTVARRRRPSAASDRKEDPGFEAFDVDDEATIGDNVDQADAFLEVRAAKAAAGLSVEDLNATAEVDSDDEQSWDDARKANQGLDDEYIGWDEFCSPVQPLAPTGARTQPARAQMAAVPSPVSTSRGSSTSGKNRSGLPLPPSVPIAASPKSSSNSRSGRSTMPGSLPTSISSRP